jgi:hypothetical protein
MGVAFESSSSAPIITSAKSALDRRHRTGVGSSGRSGGLFESALPTSEAHCPTRLGGGDLRVMHRCTQCNAIVENYDEETISLCLICIATFVQREPTMAAPLLCRFLLTTSR